MNFDCGNCTSLNCEKCMENPPTQLRNEKFCGQCGEFKSSGQNKGRCKHWNCWKEPATNACKHFK